MEANLTSTPTNFASAQVPIVPAQGLGPYRAADYWKLPEGEPIELLRGNLIVSPSPSNTHQTILLLLSDVLLKSARKTGGYAAVAPLDVEFSDDSIVQPDLLFVVKERRSILRRHVIGAPDLAIEILSPSHAGRDRTHKLALYAEYGVREYWIVDPVERQIDFLILRQSSQGESLYEIQTLKGENYSSPLIPEITLNLPAFWDEVAVMAPSED